MPSWRIVLHEPVGDGWYWGGTPVCATVVYIEFREPVLAHGVGFTPTIQYTFVVLNRLRLSMSNSPVARFGQTRSDALLKSRLDSTSSRRPGWVSHGS